MQILLATRIAHCGLSIRLTDRLARKDVVYVGDLVQKQYDVLHWFQHESKLISEITAFMDGQGVLEFGTSIPAWSRAAASELEAIHGLPKINPKSHDRILDIPIKLLGFSTRVSRALHNDDILTVGQLAAITINEFLRTPNLGRTSFDEVRATLGDLGLAFHDDIPPLVGDKNRINALLAAVKSQDDGVDPDIERPGERGFHM
jgi:DNA-directed RNA polymerase alpha subunit